MRLLITFFVFLFPLFSLAQNLFVNTYGTASAEERAFDMVILPDHSIITIGDRYETSTFNRTGYLLKVDGDGNEQWNRQLSSNEGVYGTAICALTNGNVLVSGYDEDVPTQEYGLLVASFQSGNGLPVYQKTYQFNQRTKAVAAVPMADNGAIILCEYGSSSNYTNLLCRVNADGDTLWTSILNPYPDSETPTDLELLSDGLIISGSVEGTNSGTENRFFIKTDLNGNQLWENQDDVSDMEIGAKMCINPNGGFYSVATKRLTGTSQFKVLGSSVDDNGNIGWRETYSTQTSKIDFGYSVATMPDGGAVFVGSAYKADTSNFRDLFLVRTDANGTEVWSKYYGGSGADVGYEVKLDGDQIVAVGKSDVNQSEYILILRADLNGNAAVGITESREEFIYSVYPNPFSETLHVQASINSTLPVIMQITDLQGRVLWQSRIANRASVNLAWLPAGTYLLSTENSKAVRIVKIL